MQRNKSGRRLPLEERVDSDGFAVASGTIITNQRMTCVAVKIEDGAVQVRDTKDSSKTTLTFSREEWDSFITGVKNDEFNV
ncbi:MAG: DUF397 domain-containing protein [Candidatus Zambryskibacteria bacterium]|nr:DUF397 domain-containing protein [Candidatus Zambryskibacteria bacterium]